MKQGSTRTVFKPLVGHGPSVLGSEIALTPKVSTFREALSHTIRIVHGLPDVLDCDLQQVCVYIGRASSTGTGLYGRWVSNANRKDTSKASLIALPVFRTSTEKLRSENWETKAQRIVKSLSDNKGLCITNATTGTNGKWPSSELSIVYIMAWRRKGRVGNGISSEGLLAAIQAISCASDISGNALVDTIRMIGSPDDYRTSLSLYKPPPAPTYGKVRVGSTGKRLQSLLKKLEGRGLTLSKVAGGLNMSESTLRSYTYRQSLPGAFLDNLRAYVAQNVNPAIA